MNYDCSRCQDRGLVGGFLPAPCPDCRAADASPLVADLCREAVETRRERDRLSQRCAELEAALVRSQEDWQEMRDGRDSALASAEKMRAVCEAAVAFAATLLPDPGRVSPQLRALLDALTKPGTP